MEKLKIAIIGAGKWGQTHASVLSESHFVELTGVCDINIDNARILANKFGIKQVYSDYREMLKKCDCDAVTIATPDFLHKDPAVACAQAGKHLLIEKPLATTREDVYSIVEAVEKSGVRCMVDLHNRYNPPMAIIKDSIQSGQIGELCTAYFRLNNIKNVPMNVLNWSAKSSILWFLGSHSLDTLSWWFDDVVDRVYSVSRKGYLASLGIDTVDSYLTTIEFKKGGIAQMENGWISPNGHPLSNDFKANVLGTKGMLESHISGHDLLQMYTDERMTNPDVLIRNRVNGYAKGFAFHAISDFAERLLFNREFIVSLDEAARVSIAILSIMESAEKRMPVTVNY